MTVFPFITTGSVTRAANGYPCLVVKVANVVCNFILTAVPAGNERLVWAKALTANKTVNASTANFLIFYPPKLTNVRAASGRYL
jgi:hypothetical protein